MTDTLLLIFTIFLAIGYLIGKKSLRKRLVTYIRPKSLIKYFPAKPENTIIVFDFHDVLVDYNWPEIIKTFLKSPGKFKLFIALLNPKIWLDLVKLKSKDAVSEEYIVWLGNKHKALTPYVQLGINIANTQKTNLKMLEILKNLKQNGYELHLFSNIGLVIYNDAKVKFPEIFECFDKVIVPSEENGYLRKPYENAFENYLKEIGKTPESATTKQIVIIDDKIKTVKTGEKYGFIGIKFKNYEQFLQDLNNLGVNI